MSERIKHFLFKCILFLLIFLLLTCFPTETIRSDAERTDRKENPAFSVHIRNDSIVFPVMGIFVMPGDILPIYVENTSNQSKIELYAPCGRTTAQEDNRWEWQAPTKPGLYPVRLIQSETDATITLNVFVMLPAQWMKNGCLNGYYIGRYPETLYHDDPKYRPPDGFIEVTRENESTFISPHFQLKQFVCKDGENYPKYMALNERLIQKLEYILAAVNENGNRCETLKIMSGYRTPIYNRNIGNVKYSRHIYGDAADIFIDVQPEDDRMDDLDKNGISDIRDARQLYNTIEVLSDNPPLADLEGGLGIYDETEMHGPFVHVDSRGFRSRWGLASR